MINTLQLRLDCLMEKIVPLFFFDLRDGDERPDHCGLLCADLDGARREALKAAGEMLRDKPGIQPGEVWIMEVRDEAGEVRSTLTFSAT